MIPTLPEDIYVTIFQYLSLRDVFSIRKVCRSFKDMTHLRGLWILLLRTEIIERKIPIPAQVLDNLDNLGAIQLEKWVVSSVILHRNWTSASPAVRRRRHVTVGLSRARITSLHFITLEGQSSLLSISVTNRADPRMLTVECWDLNTLKCRARRTVQWFGGYAVNSDPGSTGLIAIKTPHVEVLAFDPSASSPDSAFTTLITLTNAARSVLSLNGTTMFFRATNNEIRMMDIERPLYEVMLQNSQPLSTNQLPDSFQAIVDDGYALILRTKTLELYPLDAFRTGRHPPSAPLPPITLFEFPWRIDSCCMERQASFSSLPPRESRPSINILVRYSSLFPWPVNLLHHYVLHRDEAYVPLANSSASESTNHLTIPSNNLPYHFPPVPSQTIVSPIRLFAITDMVLGRYGTAVWLDSHTEGFYNHADLGQRLAGLVLSSSESPEIRDEGVQREQEHEYRHENGSSETQAGADQTSQRAASIVYGAHESDDWNRVAIDEGEGCIAVGSVYGEIMIDEYVER